MILSPGECHCIHLAGHTQNDYISLNGVQIESSRNETLLGVVLDSDLKVDAHMKSLCKKGPSETKSSFSNKQMSFNWPKPPTFELSRKISTCLLSSDLYVPLKDPQ